MDFLFGIGLADMIVKKGRVCLHCICSPLTLSYPQVREGMVHAGMAIVDVHGAQGARTMMPLFESYLDNKRSGLSAEQEAEYDLVGGCFKVQAPLSCGVVLAALEESLVNARSCLDGRPAASQSR
eukprot:scaffold49852_cov22-Tisochrysis_lutea.AAC.4